MSNCLHSTIPGVEIYEVKAVSSVNGLFVKPFIGKFLKGFYEDGFGEVYSIIFPPGSKRGGHYHKNSTEFFCVIQGRALLRLSDGDIYQEISMDALKPLTIKIPFGIRHEIENVGEENVVLLVYWDKSYSETDNDTFD
jgi:oxalate decarboxylase/phosphoglucose isomerase-like protein (cupin superfamily)